MRRSRAALDRDLDQLAALSPADLRHRWQEVTGGPIPRVSPALLRLALGYELQTAALGGLSRAAQQTLSQVGAGQTRTAGIAPGNRLVREWNGVVHVVTIADDGRIRWNERDWSSLSAVARAITGTRWSGPAFFGLKQRMRAA